MDSSQRISLIDKNSATIETIKIRKASKQKLPLHSFEKVYKTMSVVILNKVEENDYLDPEWPGHKVSDWALVKSQLSKNQLQWFKNHLISNVCKISSLKLVNVSLTPDFFGNILIGLKSNRTVTHLQLEGCIIDNSLSALLYNALETGALAIKHLTLVGIVFKNQALNTIIQAIISQNELASGVTNLCLENCGLTQEDGEQIGKLIEDSSKLKELHLQKNSLGSRARELKLPISLTPLKNNAISRIALALNINQNLTHLILAENQLSEQDWKILSETATRLSEKHIETRENSENEKGKNTIIINATENGLGDQLSTPRLIVRGSSPRSNASNLSLSEDIKPQFSASIQIWS